ncbi:MAG: hypothetical protein HYX78_05805 [Armatimonadetes bacterium]|nr:hypothetical protein [Armatimonadota bacterium]
MYVEHNCIYTPNGLKIRFDRDATKAVVAPLKVAGVYEHILLDIETWVGVPNALSNLAAIVAAVAFGSAWWVVVAMLSGLLLGELIAQAFYSRTLGLILSGIAGFPVIVMAIAIAVGIWSAINGHWTIALTLAVAVLGNWLTLWDIFLVVTLPFNCLISRYWQSKLGLLRPWTMTERLFFGLCNMKAARLGLELDWGVYGEVMRNKRNT